MAEARLELLKNRLINPHTVKIIDRKPSTSDSESTSYILEHNGSNDVVLKERYALLDERGYAEGYLREGLAANRVYAYFQIGGLYYRAERGNDYCSINVSTREIQSNVAHAFRPKTDTVDLNPEKFSFSANLTSPNPWVNYHNLYGITYNSGGQRFKLETRVSSHGAGTYKVVLGTSHPEVVSDFFGEKRDLQGNLVTTEVNEVPFPGLSRMFIWELSQNLDDVIIDSHIAIPPAALIDANMSKLLAAGIDWYDQAQQLKWLAIDRVITPKNPLSRH